MIFPGAGAIFGGSAFIISHSGKLFGMPLSMLNNSPFHNFLIPGIVLFAVLGVIPVITAVALLRKPSNTFTEKLNLFRDMHWAWTFGIYIAFVLIIWIQVEMYFLQAVNWLHCLYMFIALTLIFISLLPAVGNFYKKEN
jgi:hypothetical protein